MARPQRQRVICTEPEFCVFSPEGIPNCEDVTLTVDEYEVVRLVDLDQLTHAQAAERMEISRPTATEIYNAARIKIAECIVNGKRLLVSGGKYHLCGGGKCGDRCRRRFERNVSAKKGDNTMRIAVTYDMGQIFQHFGHTEQFKIYDVDDGKITNEEIIFTMGKGHGALAGFLSANKTDVLICGGIGAGAQNALSEAGIQLYGGVSGSADDAVKAFIGGNLEFNPCVKCDHHDGHGEHKCGEHDCH